MTTRFDYRSVVVRALFCSFFVFAAYNPSGYSYAHWVVAAPLDQWEAKAPAGILLAGILIFLWQTTYSTLHHSGRIHVAIACVSLAIGLGSVGIIDFWRWETWVNVVLWTMVAILTIGVSIAHVHHRVAGVTHTEEVAH